MKVKLVRNAMLCAAALAAVAACGTNLEPAPRANRTPGHGAVAMESGVRMQARADAWDATPRALEEQVTPMLVTITNRSNVPIRIDYNQFRLVSAEGRRYSALPPFAIDGTVTVSATTPYYPRTGFAYAPYYSPYFASGPFYDGFGVNAGYWGAYGSLMRTVNLPTEDMLERALPEGVLQPGGEVSGFVYFEGVRPEVKRVQLRADFRNAAKNQRVARLEIPFVVK